MKKFSMNLTVIAGLWLTSTYGVRVLRGEIARPDEFDAGDLVESVELTLYVGDGAELSEPVALDLGLGFPFWLRPLGAEQTDHLPVGAIPQEAPEQTTIPPSGSATFVFRREADSGNDTLNYTPQLLDGVRISDITRLGIISKGSTDWELAGYRLVINGKTFAARDDVHRKARTEVERAQLAWIEARETLQGYAAERDDLTALEKAGLSTDQDRARLREIMSEIRPLQDHVTWNQGISACVLPWFIEEGFPVPGRDESSGITTARVTVATAQQHANAETYNYVYFRTGGKKYFLYPADNHFTAKEGFQSFDIFLTAGPLAASDVRGFSLGMLAHDRPYADAPDRWHPQRLVVEFDGRSVYDSEAAAIDRQSLEAIRLIPPAHIDGDGNVHPNVPNPRECVVWTAGQAQGLDLTNGGAAEVDEGGVAGIEPEPPDTSTPTRAGDLAGSVTTGSNSLELMGDDPGAGAVQGSDSWPGESPRDPDPWEPLGPEPFDFPPDDPSGTDPAIAGYGTSGSGVQWDDPPFGAEGNAPASSGSSLPGFELGPDGTWVPNGIDGIGASENGVPQDAFDNAPNPVLDALGWLIFVAWVNDLVNNVQAGLGTVPGAPQPIGEPPQVHDVRLLRNPFNPSQYQVFWEISGDQSQISYCTVALWHVKPETGLLLEKVVAAQRDVPAEIKVSEWLTPEGPVDPAGYIEPVVVIVTQDAEGESNWPQVAIGPALPWLRPDATKANQPRPEPPLTDQEPAEGAPGAWTMEVMPTNSARRLATGGITTNVVQHSNEVRVRFVVDELLDPARRYELIGHYGLLEPLTDEPVRCVLHVNGFGVGPDAGDYTLDVQWVAAEGQPRLFRIPVDPTKFLSPSFYGYQLRFDIGFGTNGPGLPQPQLPAIYGLRLVPVDQ